MQTILENVSSKESVRIAYIKEQARLKFHFSNEYNREFSLTTFSKEEEFASEPTVTFDIKAKVKASALKKVTADCKNIGDHVTIETEGDAITFKTIGVAGTFVSVFKRGTPPLIELLTQKESNATYNVELFDSIIKTASSMSDTVVVEYSTNHALRLDFLLPQGKLHFYLSPALEAD